MKPESVIVDICVLFFFTGCYPSHTFLGATTLSLAVIIAIYILRSPIEPISNCFKIEQDYSLQSIVIGAVFGVWIHIILDAFLYPEMSPFWPYPENPLVGTFDVIIVYGFCIVGFVIGGMIYTYNSYKNHA